MEKIYLLVQESCVDGEILINVIPCSILEIAKRKMNEMKEYILNVCPHYINYKDYPEDYQIEEHEFGVFINNICDDYYEKIDIIDKDILTE